MWLEEFVRLAFVARFPSGNRQIVRQPLIVCSRLRSKALPLFPFVGNGVGPEYHLLGDLTPVTFVVGHLNLDDLLKQGGQMTQPHGTLPPLDAYTASSLLQKAIRRGDADLAVQAGGVLLRLRGKMIWRRLTLIAYEDVGVGDPDLCVDVTLLATDAERRITVGADHDIALELVRRLAMAPKNREADYLICTSIQAPRTNLVRARLGGLSVSERGRVAADPQKPILERSVAAWMASGINGGGPKVLDHGDLQGMMLLLSAGGAHAGVCDAASVAARLTQEPIVLMVPLLSALLHERRERLVLVDECPPPPQYPRGVPTYTFDKHTRIGKAAIAALLRENVQVRQCLGEYVPEFRALDVAAMASFYVDAVPLLRRSAWSQSDELYSLGLQTDMDKVGTPDEGILPILSIIRESRLHLDEIRCRLYDRSHQQPSGELPLFMEVTR